MCVCVGVAFIWAILRRFEWGKNRNKTVIKMTMMMIEIEIGIVIVLQLLELVCRLQLAVFRPQFAACRL